jgi:hypothetical protein
MTQSLPNTPTPPFPGAANALYGDRGPQRSHNTGRQRKGHFTETQSIADHVEQAIDRVAGLGPKQRLALHSELVRMTRDISFIRLIHESTRGPYSEAAVQDEGRPL